MRNQRAARWVGIVAGVAILVSGAATVAHWTLIPLALDAGVVKVGYSDGTGGHFRTLDLDDGRTVTIEQGLLDRVGGDKALVGSHLRKDRWQRHVFVDGHPVPLSIPTDVWMTLAALAVPVVTGWWLRGAARRSTPSG